MADEKQSEKRKARKQSKEEDDRIITRNKKYSDKNGRDETEKRKPSEAEEESSKSYEHETTGIHEKEDVGNEVKTLLSFLHLIQRSIIHDIVITGFQAKDFFESIYPDIDVDETYAKLKEKGFVEKRKDNKKARLTIEGRDEAKKYPEKSEEVLKKIASQEIKRLEENENLRRLLLLAYDNKFEFREYLPMMKAKLGEKDEILACLFGEDSFLEQPEVEKKLRKLRKKVSVNIQEKVEQLAEDPDFLKALAMLRPQKVLEILNTSEHRTTFGNLKESLSYYMDDSKYGKVLSDIFLLGLTESENLFRVDIDSILESNAEIIKEWLQFNEQDLIKELKTDWVLFLDASRAVGEGGKPSNPQKLLQYGALIPSKNGFIVREELRRVWETAYNRIEENLKDRTQGFDGVLTLTLFDFDEAENSDSGIIVTLHATNLSSRKHFYPAFEKARRNLLEDKIVLVVSPKELGFHVMERFRTIGIPLESPNKNKEYNAIGEVKGLQELKKRFSECRWVSMGDDSIVKEAKEERKRREIPKINFDDALEEIKNKGLIYQEALCSLTHRATSPSGMRYFSKNLMWGDLKSNLRARYPELGESQFEEIKKAIEYIVEKKAERNLISLDSKEIYNKFMNELNEQIFQRIKDLDEKSKKALVLFLEFLPASAGRLKGDYEDYLEKFNLLYQLHFGEKFEMSLPDLLLEVGLIVEGTWITAKGKNNGDDYEFYTGLNEIKDTILEQIDVEIEEPDTASFKGQFENNVAELAGIEFLLQHNGIADRNEMRGALLNISPGAWMEFQEYPGIISPKNNEKIALNPLKSKELRNWVAERKKVFLDKKNDIISVLNSLNIIDYRLDFDETEGIYKGFFMTPDKDRINVIISPWYLLTYSSLFGQKNLVIVTEGYSKDVLNVLKNMEFKKTLFLGFEGNKFSVFSNLPKHNFVKSVIDAMQEKYELKKQEIETPESEEETVEEYEERRETETSPEEGEGPQNLFEKIIDTKKKSFPAGLTRDRPVVVILHDSEEDNFGLAIQTICRELYHELKGGLPSARIHSKRKEVEEELEAEGNIQLVDESNDEFFKGSLSNLHTNMEEVRWDTVKRRLMELYSQGLGFIIFQVPSPIAGEFRERLENEVKPNKPEIFELDPVIQGQNRTILITDKGRKEIEDPSVVKEKITNELWGRVLDESSVTGEKDFDSLFATAERLFNDKLNKYSNQLIRSEGKGKSPTMLVNRSPTIADDPVNYESPLHFNLKVFVVKYLVETEKYSFDSVDTEDDTPIAHDSSKQVIPDVQAGNRIFEIETLYSSGNPLAKIKETIEKYKDSGLRLEINVVLTNLDGFLWYKELKQIQKEVKEDWGLNLKFKIPQLKEKRLLDIGNIREIINKVLR